MNKNNIFRNIAVLVAHAVVFVILGMALKYVHAKTFEPRLKKAFYYANKNCIKVWEKNKKS